MGLIDTLDGKTIDVHRAEARLRLRGSIRLILPVQSADDMEAWLRKYRAVDGSTEDSDESELSDS